jgi:uncharacterized RDD family membrane protein YckC
MASTLRPPAGLARRLGAIFYDSLLLVAVLMLTTALLLPLNGGRAITVDEDGFYAYVYQGLLVAVAFAYFAVSWTRGGQTLGMLAWRIRVERADGTRLRLRHALARFAAAVPSLLPAGLGLFWVLVDRDRLAWHDRWSATRVVLMPIR